MAKISLMREDSKNIFEQNSSLLYILTAYPVNAYVFMRIVFVCCNVLLNDVNSQTRGNRVTYNSSNGHRTGGGPKGNGCSSANEPPPPPPTFTPATHLSSNFPLGLADIHDNDYMRNLYLSVVIPAASTLGTSYHQRRSSRLALVIMAVPFRAIKACKHSPFSTGAAHINNRCTITGG